MNDSKAAPPVKSEGASPGQVARARRGAPAPKRPLEIEHISRWIVLGATVWMLGIGMWEIAGPFGAGHAAVLPARGIIADNMIRWGIGFPVRSYANVKPTLDAAYAHHPFGTYYLFAVVRALLGRHEWAIRLVPVLVSSAMPGLLAAVGRRLFGALAGAMAAVGWAVLPIALAFAQFPSFEMFSLAAMLSVTLAALRFEERMSSRRLAELVFAVAIALQTDWIAYLFIAGLVAVATAAVAFGPKRGLDKDALRWCLQALVLVVGVFALSLLVYVVTFRHAGLLQDWLSSADTRARGNEMPLTEVVNHRRYWIEVMFTKLGILTGLLGALLMLARLVFLRRFAEIYPVLILAVAAIHYTHFKNGADVHIYWPLPFAAQYGFALAVIARSIEDLGNWWVKRRGLPTTAQQASRVALGIAGTLGLLQLPDGLRALDYSRDSGFRLNDDGLLNLQDLDKNLALTFFKQHIPEGQPVLLQPSMFPNWSQDWALQRPTTMQTALGLSMLGPVRHAVLDTRFAMPTAATWAVQSATTVVGSFWHVDVESRPGELRVFGFEERKPSWLERTFVQAHDPIRRIVEDPYRTWEYRQHLALKPNPIPEGLDQQHLQRVLHNVLVAQQDEAGAARVRAELEAVLDKRSARDFERGLRLLGHRLIEGTVPRLEVYFLAATSVGPDAFFDVRSRIVRAPLLSFVVQDDKEKKYGVGFEIHPSLWQKGMIYVSSIEVRRRPGRESFYAIWTGSQRPRPTEGVEAIPLFER